MRRLSSLGRPGASCSKRRG